MIHLLYRGGVLGFLLAAAVAPGASVAVEPAAGVPEDLARARAAAIADLRYEVLFSVPARRDEPVHGRVIARFSLRVPEAVVLDFEQPAERVHRVEVAGHAALFRLVNGHIVIPAAAMRAGENEVGVEFTAGDEALKRSDDFLYTLFVPARAHLAFPCFDQRISRRATR